MSTRYKNYKDTGFKWIGEIPDEWILSRMGNFFSERIEKVDDVSFPPLSVTMLGVVNQLDDVAKSDDSDNRKLVKKNDFVINSRSDRKGSSGIAKRDGSVSLINIVLKPQNLNPRFIQYLFKSYYFKEEFFRNGKGIHWDLWTTRWDQLKNINIPIPQIDHQEIISSYLDKKIKQIEKLIDNFQKKIKLLIEQKTSLIHICVTKGIDPNVVMKNSNMEYVGDIPKNWRLSKIKYVCQIFGRIGYRGYTVDDIVGKNEGCITLGPGNIYEQKLTLKNLTYLSFKKYEESPEIQIFNDDIIFVKTGSTIGKSCIIKNVKTKMTINPQLIVLKNIKISRDYLYYLSISRYFQSYFDTEQGGGSTPAISQEKIKDFKILIPPINEQDEIVKFLEEKLYFINLLIKKYDNKIYLQKEYLQSLVSSIVTGKIKVTEDMI